MNELNEALYGRPEAHIYTLKNDLKTYMDVYKENNGYYCFCYGKKGSVWKQEFISDISELEAKVAEYGNNYNCYLSQATFKSTRNRSENNVLSLNKLFIDIDSDKNNSLTKLECEELNTLILEQLELKPTLSVFTGHGLQMIWNVQGIPLDDWKTYETSLHTHIKAVIKDIKENSICNLVNRMEYCNLKIDNSVKDTARVLRVPTTINLNDTKTDLYCCILGFNTTSYNKTKLDKIGLNKPKNKGYNDIKRDKEYTYPDFTTEYKITAFQKKQIEPRLIDLKALIDLRNEKNITSGFRNNLFRVAVATCQNLGMKPKETEKELKRLNQCLKKPTSESEFKNWIQATYKTRVIDGKYKKGVRYTTETIIELLGITPEEQKKMIVLVSKKEQKERRKKKRLHKEDKNREKTARKKEQRNKKIIAMSNQGISNTDIAKTLNISRKTVYTVLKKNS